MNTESSESSEAHKFMINMTDKINLKRSGKFESRWNLSIYYTWRNTKKSYKEINPPINSIS